MAKIKTKPIQGATAWGEVPLDEIVPSPWQTRTLRADGSDLTELVESIRSSGVIQPIVVRELPRGRYELVAGERRTRASRLAGLASIPAVVRELTDDQAMELTVIENLQRADLAAWEEAAGVQILLEREGWTPEAVAEEIGYSTSWVHRRAQITKLSPAWQKAVRDPDSHLGSLGAGHLERIARLPEDFQDRLLGMDYLWSDRFEDAPAVPTLSRLDQVIAQEMHRMSAAPWKLDDAELLPAAGPCSTCPKRSGANRHLWEELDEGNGNNDQCLDVACWGRKMAAHLNRKIKEVKAEHGKKPRILSRGGRWGSDPGEPKSMRKLREDSVAEYAVIKAKKGAQGAAPYLVIDGPEAGHVVWATVDTHPSGLGRQKRSGPTPLKERREKLRRRRLKMAIESVVEAVWDATATGQAPSLSHVAALAAAVGTKHDNEGAPSSSSYSGHLGASEYQVLPAGRWENGKKPPLPALQTWPPKGVGPGRRLWPMVEAYRAAEDALRQDLWLAVWAVLRSRLSYGAHTDVELQWLEAQGVATLFAVDSKAILRSAEDALPQPKTWALLNEDGTPKSSAEKTSKPKPRKRRAKNAKKKSGSAAASA